MRYYSIGEFSRLIGKTTQTIRNWDRENILKPHHIGPGGFRYYSDMELNKVLGIETNKDKKIIALCFCEFATEETVERTKAYMAARGYRFEVIRDMGNGDGTANVVDLIIDQKVYKLIIYSKSILSKPCYRMLEVLCNKFAVELEIIDNSL